MRRLGRDAAATRGIDSVDAVVNLAGENIFQRWTPSARRRIRDSRVSTTGAIADAIAAAPRKPRVLLSGSAIGIYGNRGDEVLDEASALGDDFLASVCKDWEAATQPAEQTGVRVVHLRTGIVLARGGGALGKMLLPFRLGLGGRLGSGRQWTSWISLPDHVNAMLFLLDTVTAAGSANLVAPEPVRNSEFARTLGRTVHRPAALPVPAFALKLALGTMAEDTVLASQRVTPRKLDQWGFRYEHRRIDVALSAIVS